MTKSRKLLVFGVAAVVLISAIAALAFTFSKGQEYYRFLEVREYRGSVAFEREGKNHKLFEGLHLVSKDKIITGADSDILLLADFDKHIFVEDNTAFIIETEGNETKGRIAINLLYGGSLFTIDRKLPAGSEFVVNSPNATLSVRGTVFHVDYDPETNTTTVEVTEGVVEVSSGEEIQNIEAGVSCVVKDDNIIIISDSELNDNSDDGSNANNDDSSGLNIEVPTASLFMTRMYKLTGDESYRTAGPEYYSLLIDEPNTLEALETPRQYNYASDAEYIDRNPWLDETLKELKTYTEAHIDEINEYFDKNKNIAVDEFRTGNYVQENRKVTDWFPEVIEIHNETGVYLFRISEASMSAHASHKSVNILDNFISDYYIKDENIAVSATDVSFSIFGTIEKILDEDNSTVTTTAINETSSETSVSSKPAETTSVTSSTAPETLATVKPSVTENTTREASVTSGYEAQDVANMLMDYISGKGKINKEMLANVKRARIMLGNIGASDYYISVFVDGYTVPEQINIKDCNIKDYSFVNYFYSIEELALGYLNITDEELAAIDFEKLSGLKRLNLGGNEISDISQLKHLKKLEYLQLINNDISDITPLKDLTNLKELLLDINKISDVTALKSLTNLEKLSLSSNELTDISPLKKLTKLKSLVLVGNYFLPKSEIEALRKALPDCEIETLDY